MAKIKWVKSVKLWNKAIGLPGPDVTRPIAGAEMEVPDDALPTLEKRYGKGAFEIIGKAKPKPKPQPKKGGRT